MIIIRKVQIVVRLFRSYKYSLLIFSLLFIFFILILLMPFNESGQSSVLPVPNNKIVINPVNLSISELKLKIPSVAEFRQNAVRKKMKAFSAKKTNHITEKLINISSPSQPNYDVYIFYYAWYKSMISDADWRHWNSEHLSWGKDKPTDSFGCPMDLASNFYPQAGCYSSKNKTIIDIHMNQIRKAGIGTVVVAWWPDGCPDSADEVFQLILDSAAAHQLRVSPHLQHYDGRDSTLIASHIHHLFNTYGFHEAFRKQTRDGFDYPIYFVSESYRIEPAKWRELLTKGGSHSVRGTIYDGIFYAMLTEPSHRYHIRKSNFDGFYTYFSGNGLTFGSTWKNWPALAKFASESKLIFVPCVGPGHSAVSPCDSSLGQGLIVPPCDPRATRHRHHGAYFEVGWRSAIWVGTQSVGLVSFNHWAEGSQLEPARSGGHLDYEPEGSTFYMDLTQWWVSYFTSLYSPSRSVTDHRKNRWGQH